MYTLFLCGHCRHRFATALLKTQTQPQDVEPVYIIAVRTRNTHPYISTANTCMYIVYVCYYAESMRANALDGSLLTLALDRIMFQCLVPCARARALHCQLAAPASQAIRHTDTIRTRAAVSVRARVCVQNACRVYRVSASLSCVRFIAFCSCVCVFVSLY